MNALKPKQKGVCRPQYLSQTIRAYDHMAPTYGEKRACLVNAEDMTSFESLLKGRRVLDAGSGPGRDAHLLAARGLRVVGIDLSRNLLKVAAEGKSTARFLPMDIRQLQFRDRSFDGIWCSVVLTHLNQRDVLKALKEFRRVLRPGGVLLTIVKKGIGARTGPLDRAFSSPVFMQLYTEKEYVALISSVGFRIEYSYCFNEKRRFGPNHRDIDFIVVMALRERE